MSRDKFALDYFLRQVLLKPARQIAWRVFSILRTIRMVKRSRRERKLEPEDALELERSYLEALLRVEAHAADVAHELGLAGLKERIIADRRHAEQFLLELLAEQRAATERKSGNTSDAS